MACLFSNCFCELDYTLSVKKPVFLRFLGVLDVIPTRQILIFSRLFSIKNHAIRLYFGECSVCFHCYHDFLVSK